MSGTWTWTLTVSNSNTVGTAPATFAEHERDLARQPPEHKCQLQHGDDSLIRPASVGRGPQLLCREQRPLLHRERRHGEPRAGRQLSGQRRGYPQPRPAPTRTLAEGVGNVCAVDPAGVIPESNEGNNTCTNNVAVTAPDLTVVKSNNVSGPDVLGGSWTWTLAVTNASGVSSAPAIFASGNVILRDSLPNANIGYGCRRSPTGRAFHRDHDCTIVSNDLTCTAGGGSGHPRAGRRLRGRRYGDGLGSGGVHESAHGVGSVVCGRP